MRQQDFKMVQGVNQTVQMNAPQVSQRYDTSRSIGGSNVRSGNAEVIGGAIGRLGDQLARTGQDVANVMQETAETQDRVELMRATQKWSEIENEQLVFQDANRGNPLSWDENRTKLMEKFNAYNNTVTRSTQRGKIDFTMASEKFSSDFKNSTFRGMHKRINMNLVEEGNIAINNSIDAGFPETAKSILKDIAPSLTPDAEEAILKKIQSGEEQLDMNMKYDWIDSDPRESLEAINKKTGVFSNIDRDTKEKLLAYQNRMQQRGISEQMNDFEVASSHPDYTRGDFYKAIEDGKFDQLKTGDLAKMKAAMEKDRPLTNAEIKRAHSILVEAKDNKEEMDEADYVEDFNNKNIELKTLIGSNKDYGWMKAAMNERSPYKTRGSTNLLAQNKTDNTNQVLALLDYDMKSGNMTVNDETGGWKSGRFNLDRMTLEQEHEAGMQQKEIMREARKWINRQTKELTSEDVNEWYRKEFKGSRAATTYKQKSGVAPQPKRTEKKNTRSEFRTKDKSFKSDINDMPKGASNRQNPWGKLGGDLLEMESDEELEKLLEMGKAAAIALDIRAGEKGRVASN